MTDHPMFLRYDWTSNTYSLHLGGAFTIEHSFETLAAARHALHLIGYGSEIRPMSAHGGSNSWEPVAERADAFRLGSRAHRLNAQDRPLKSNARARSSAQPENPQKS
jgi:hypothetical protein